MRWAASFRTSGLRHPALFDRDEGDRLERDPCEAGRAARPIPRDSFDRVFNGWASMFQPLVIRRETSDAHSDAALQEIPREPFRPSATHVVQFPEYLVLPEADSPRLDNLRPGGIHGHHRSMAAEVSMRPNPHADCACAVRLEKNSERSASPSTRRGLIA